MPGPTDSAGVPWEGREFHAHRSSGDDGAADPRLIEAIRRFRAGESGVADVVEALHSVRLLVPLIAVRGEEGVGAHGQTVDKTQELSIVTVEGPDGRAVQPVFTSVDAMRAWDAQARPVPVEASRVALAAASEGTELVVLDPGGESEFAVRRPALRSMATGERWTPCFLDEEVLEAFLESARPEPEVSAVVLAPGDPAARLGGPELVVRLGVVAGLDRDRLTSLLTRLQTRWSGHPLIAERVDSLNITVTPA